MGWPDAKPGREIDLETVLRGAAPLAQAEPTTLVWFAVRIGPATFGIFDAFPDEAGRGAHLVGRQVGSMRIRRARRRCGPLRQSSESTYWREFIIEASANLAVVDTADRLCRPWLIVMNCP